MSFHGIAVTLLLSTSHNIFDHILLLEFLEFVTFADIGFLHMLFIVWKALAPGPSLVNCYGLNVRVPQNSSVEILPLMVMVLGGRASLEDELN